VAAETEAAVEIIIKGDPKEIAALIVELQKRLNVEADICELAKNAEREIARKITN
jgi:hypothetical protein